MEKQELQVVDMKILEEIHENILQMLEKYQLPIPMAVGLLECVKQEILTEQDFIDDEEWE